MSLSPGEFPNLKYKHVEHEVRNLVRSTPLGSKLPPERDLAASLNCNVLTVRKGIQPLVDEGLLRRRVGSGTFVAKHEKGEDSASLSTGSAASIPGMDHIGVLLHPSSDPYANRVARALADEALHRGTELRSIWTRDYKTASIDTVKDMVQAGCQALILPWFPAEDVENVRVFAHKSPIPVVLPQIISGLEHLCFEELGVYGASTTLEVEGACEYFLRLGLNRIHFIGPDHSLAPVLQQRITAYVRCASKKGFEPTFRLFDRTPESVDALAKREKNLAGDLAVFSYDDTHAIRFMTAMHKIGLSAPKDYRIIGHNDTGIARHSDPPLSTLRQNFEYIGRAMLDSALALAHGRQCQSTASPNPQLIVRQSCGGRETAADLDIPALDIHIEDQSDLLAEASTHSSPLKQRV